MRRGRRRGKRAELSEVGESDVVQCLGIEISTIFMKRGRERENTGVRGR